MQFGGVYCLDPQPLKQDPWYFFNTARLQKYVKFEVDELINHAALEAIVSQITYRAGRTTDTFVYIDKMQTMLFRSWNLSFRHLLLIEILIEYVLIPELQT